MISINEAYAPLIYPELIFINLKNYNFLLKKLELFVSTHYSLPFNISNSWFSQQLQ